ncbi:FAD-binding oxidoreductase [Saccharopolyspora gloriosae]|uniref:FAD/FMN-containing dehydrogenase n=1 Tax=Saccharopolyspora gloriosae TaxID=455344 RepID=A0A840NRX0_9PSEU|nr:FAD-binding oxidoreductase [Saccharopolyspora gloriosae]MBB5072695.1 FAD/FMN-containing dehydrogenase [Saccharopolyspora gloriosae]
MPVLLRTLTSGETSLEDGELDALRAGFRGPLIGPGDDLYEQACVVQNGMFHRRPALIARCSGTADVVDAVRLARDHDLLIAVRGGGHSVAGHSIHDGALLIDLSAMRGVDVDPQRRVARVQGGATWGDVDRETQLFGLAVPGGIVSSTGVGGLTLGGGIGWLHRAHGLACDNLRSAEVVTADGKVRRAGPEDPELLWALRGAGGNFGVVTAFEFDAHPLGPTVANGTAIYPAADAGQVLRAWRDWASGLPDEITTRAVLWTLPASPALPAELHDQDVLIIGAVHAGHVEDGMTALEPMRRFGTPLADLSGPAPYTAVQQAFDPFFPKGGLLSYWKSLYFRELDDAVLDLLVRRGRERPHPVTMLHVPLLGGAAGRVPAADTAFGDRNADYLLSVDANWTDADDTARAVRWVRDVLAEAESMPGAAGTYLNFSGEAVLDPGARASAYGDNLERLGRAKARYDPHNRFRLNNNIPPQG